ncbi:glutathione S-transferase family protein [Ruegeria meonggei]|uniref:Glutathione S-transferase GstB n=1 Tax=Ruegeria meonggei TaxID=1446476 RepID=A0A1X6YYI2_9RHOB|nr:glutathione S-transferase family protein [Ruegeria meonggei]SLN35443.1 Glutathione S-transferase GstB [Ruegeria meonggei]
MLEIWGRPYSSNVIPVIWTANELGLAYTLQLAGGSFGKLDTDTYAQINPNRMIPAIRDGDFALWESLAIVRYLCDRYGSGTLSPSDVQTRAVADQWMEWSASLAFTPVIQLFFATVRTQPNQRDSAKITALRDQAHKALSVAEGHLADRPYVCGDAFTMGDIPLGCVVYRYFTVEVDRPPLPNVEAWYQRLADRPAFQDHVMRHFGTNPDEWAALEEACASEGVL